MSVMTAESQTQPVLSVMWSLTDPSPAQSVFLPAVFPKSCLLTDILHHRRMAEQSRRLYLPNNHCFHPTQHLMSAAQRQYSYALLTVFFVGWRFFLSHFSWSFAFAFIYSISIHECSLSFPLLCGLPYRYKYESGVQKSHLFIKKLNFFIYRSDRIPFIVTIYSHFYRFDPHIPS